MASTLKQGMKSPEVTQLKKLLNGKLTPNPMLSASQEFGPKTTLAVRRFQKQAGLAQTGVVDAATWKALGVINLAPQPAKLATPPLLGKSVIRSSKMPGLEIEIRVEYKPNGVLGNGQKGALTTANPVGDFAAAPAPDKPAGTSFIHTPNFEWAGPKGQEKIVKVVGPAMIKGTVVIQTNYAPGANAMQASGYGRGTTATDKAAHNTTLGFHEQCHREDFVAFLKAYNFPTFTGRVGMTVAEYKRAMQAFGAGVNAVWKAMETYSGKKTDQVGWTLEKYNRLGQEP